MKLISIKIVVHTVQKYQRGEFLLKWLHILYLLWVQISVSELSRKVGTCMFTAEELISLVF